MIMDVLAKAKQFLPLIRHSPLIIACRFIHHSHIRYRSSGAHFEMCIISTVELGQSDTCVFPTSCDIRQKCTMHGPKVFLLTKNKIKPEYCKILCNPTHFPGPLVCRIRQVPLHLAEALVVLLVCVVFLWVFL